jgi:tRNA 2-thiouridine synthesizing protein A
MELRRVLLALAPGQVLHLRATDPGVVEDLPSWCRLTGHALVASSPPDYWIRKKGA